jgi:hypothetical protein
LARIELGVQPKRFRNAFEKWGREEKPR